MLKHYENYNPVRWSITLDKYVKDAGKYKLCEIEYVPITEDELDYIKDIENIRLERIMFTLLCFAKLYNLKNIKNNNWVNIRSGHIVSLARVTAAVRQQGSFYNKLKQLGLIDLSTYVGKFNMKVNFIDNEGTPVLMVSDFRELGYEYMSWKNGGYFRCKQCGILSKQNKFGNRVYCKDCVGYQPIETKIIICVDCGADIQVNSKNTKTVRCADCQHKKQLEYQRISMNKARM